MTKLALKDGFQNVSANLNTARDKSSTNAYVDRQLSSNELYTIYRNSWLAKKIINIPAEDAVGQWRSWSADKNQISLLEGVERTFRLQHKVQEAIIAARLYGGAAIYIGGADGMPEAPLDPERGVGKGWLRSLTVLPKMYLVGGETDWDPESPYFGKPAYYTLSISGNVLQQGLRIHPSRLSFFQGAALPNYSLSSDGWGDSVLQSTFDAIAHTDSVAANVASLVFEANVDVLGVPRLMEMLMEPGGDEKVSQYLKTLALMKSNNGMLVLDAGDTSETEGNTGGTTYERKGAQFAGLGDIWDRFMQVISGASDIPATRLFGRSPAGMNSTGESDMNNYHQRLSTMQTLEIGPAIEILNEVLIRSALGIRPDEITYSWRPVAPATMETRLANAKTLTDVLKTVNDLAVLPVGTLQTVVVNGLIELDALPGLESAVEEEGALALEEDEGEEDLEVADPNADEEAMQPGSEAEKATISDAAPKSLYVRRDLKNVEDVLAWAEAQGITISDPNSLHVTVTYSNGPVDWMKMGNDWGGPDGNGDLVVADGGPRMLGQLGPNKDVLVLLFWSSSLAWRHEDMIRQGATWDWPEYQPHITLNYSAGSVDLDGLTPYRGKLVFGPEIFEEVDENWALHFKDEAMNQPRAPKGSSNGGQWIKSGAGGSSAVDKAAASVATSKYSADKVKALANKAPSELSHYEKKMVAKYKKALVAQKASAAPAGTVGSAKKAETSSKKAAETAPSPATSTPISTSSLVDKAAASVATGKYPADKVKELVNSDPKNLSQYEKKVVAKYKKALVAQQSSSQTAAAVVPSQTVTKVSASDPAVVKAASQYGLKAETVANITNGDWEAKSYQVAAATQVSETLGLNNKFNKADKIQANNTAPDFTYSYSNAGPTAQQAKTYGVNASVPQKTLADFKAWPASLTTEETSTLQEYTGSLYKSLNSNLRNGITESAHSTYISSIDSAISKYEVKSDTTFLRGIKSEGVQALLKSAGGSLNYGDVVSDAGYMSMTRSTNVANSFAGNGYVMVIKAKKGSSVSPLKSISHYAQEDEFLAARGTKMKVIGVNHKERSIHLEII